VLGPIFTTVPLAKYFTDRTFFSYFMNVFGWIHYLLPGVFKTNPTINVNGALWTVPYEIGCYVLFAAMMIFGLVKRQLGPFFVGVVLMLLAVAVQETAFFTDSEGHPHSIRTVLSFLFIEKGARLLPSFLLGIVFYQFRYKIPYSRTLLAAVTVLWALVCVAGNFKLLFNNTIFHAVALPILAYLTVLIGLTPIGIPYPFTKGDYSYGLYLYHAPFMQGLIYMFPKLFTNDRTFWVLFLAAYPICLLVAVCSWHIVEKPILGLRKKFSFAITRREAEAPVHPAPAPAHSVPPSEVPAPALNPPSSV